jgi:hypothetical protein
MAQNGPKCSSSVRDGSHARPCAFVSSVAQSGRMDWQALPQRFGSNIRDTL